MSTGNITQLWSRVLRKESSAFEEFVTRFQTLVCSVAYSICGDRTLSEDAAQETFLTVWKQPESLRDPQKLIPWLCGIARNLARNKSRSHFKSDIAQTLEDVAEPVAAHHPPEEHLVSEEEETLVWQALEEIPENYREPLVLFYRQDHSVQQVADALEISNDAAKQRLSRGREMLRDQVATLVESALTRSRPGKKFTLAVMAGVSSLSIGTKSALAAGVGGAGVGAGVKAASAISLGGLAGGLLGAAGGLGGGYLGTWFSAQAAPTVQERDLMFKRGKVIFGWAILVTVMILVFSVLPLLRNEWSFWVSLGGIGVSVLMFTLFCVFYSLQTTRLVKRLRIDSAGSMEPNDSSVRQFINRMATRYKGRSYTSQASLFGWPLVDIQSRSGLNHMGLQHKPGHARGWIALGDRADGLLFAFGGIARGFIALGGMTAGVVSLGGLAIGVFTLGGLAMGVLALGGLAFGWQAAGGGAVGYNFAVGGGAVAYTSASGGAALAVEHAVGGLAIAKHANDELAKSIIEPHWLTQGMVLVTSQQWIIIVFTAVMVGISLLISRLLYRGIPEPATTTNS